MLLEGAFRLLGHTAGAALHLFLIALAAPKWRQGGLHRAVLALLAALGFWHLSGAVSLFHRATTGSEADLFLTFWELAATLGLAATPPVLWHFAVRLTGRVKQRAWLAYLAAPLAWWLLRTGGFAGYAVLLGASLAGPAILLEGAARSRQGFERRFLRALAISFVAVIAGGAWGGSGSSWLVFASLTPPACLAWFIYRYNLLELLISRRIVFALTLGFVSAAYLLVVRRVSDYVEDEFQVFGALVHLALILAAAGIWLPLYGWMNRFLSKRTQLYADFSKRLIEEAARILELDKRVQFLAEEAGRRLGLRRVLLIMAGDQPVYGLYGWEMERGAPPFQKLEGLLRLTREQNLEMVHRTGEGPPEVRALLDQLRFSYLIGLMYEGQVIGLLLLDTAPRLYVDEDKSVLLGLSRQISESLETCRVIEEKIRLERTLAEQEHLAGLGKVAATIAHEIKNPLSSMKTLAQLMREDHEVESRYSRDLAYMLGEIDRLDRSVQQLLSFSRPLAEAETEVDVAEVVRSTAEVLAREWAPQQIRVEHHADVALRLKHAPPGAVKQIVLNLALNAIQASPPGGRVVLEARAIPERWIGITVSDEGPGVPPEMRERIFEPFFTTKQKGTGLGLAIVRKNVRHLRGEVQVESPAMDGHGTRIRVTVPAE